MYVKHKNDNLCEKINTPTHCQTGIDIKLQN